MRAIDIEEVNRKIGGVEAWLEANKDIIAKIQKKISLLARFTFFF